MEISKEKLLDLYTTMVKIRLFEDRIVDLYARGSGSRARAPLHRRGGGCGRRLRGIEGGRLHHEHAPGARARHRQGGGA
jgi:hypothetical protein